MNADPTDTRYINQGNQPALFNYDDEAVEESEPEVELSWRLDPAVSLSDWTINVFNTETRTPQSYFVHKNSLAVGPRKSEFFVRYFLSHDNVQASKTSTDVWLERVAADCMPQYLDYIYSTKGEVELSTETSVGLRYLAQYFGNRKLHAKVIKFIRQDISMDNVLVYYQHALTVDDEKVTEITAQKISENIMQVDPKNELLLHIDPSFLRRVMGSKHINTEEKQYHISILLAEYCQINKKHLDDQDFIRLTSDKFLPLVHYNAALVLLEMEADLVVSNEEEGTVSSLQQRCIKDLSDHWQEFSEFKHSEVIRVMNKLSSGVVGDMLMKTIAKAKTELEEGGVIEKKPSQMETGKAKVAEFHEKKVQVEKNAELEAKHQKQLATLKAEFEKSLLKLRDVALEKDKIIANLKKEMAKFERMPNEPGGRLMQSGEQQQPDAMPPRGEYSTEGLVLCKPKGAGKFPVFFYNYQAVMEDSSSVGSANQGQKGKGAGKKVNGAKKTGGTRSKQAPKKQ